MNTLCLTQLDVMYIVVAALALVIAVLIAVVVNLTRKKADPRKNLEVQQPEFAEPKLNKQNEMFITIARNVTATVGVNGQIRPGSYLIRSATNDKTMNVRYNGLVKQYNGESKITLGEGDTICCVSDGLVIVADL